MHTFILIQGNAPAGGNIIMEAIVIFVLSDNGSRDCFFLAFCYRLSVAISRLITTTGFKYYGFEFCKDLQKMPNVLMKKISFWFACRSLQNECELFLPFPVYPTLFFSKRRCLRFLPFLRACTEILKYTFSFFLSSITNANSVSTAIAIQVTILVRWFAAFLYCSSNVCHPHFLRWQIVHSRSECGQALGNHPRPSRGDQLSKILGKIAWLALFSVLLQSFYGLSVFFLTPFYQNFCIIPNVCIYVSQILKKC